VARRQNPARDGRAETESGWNRYWPGDAGEGVLGPRRLLHSDDAEPLAQARPRKPVGHVLGDPLLPGDDRPDLRDRQGLKDWSIGKTENLLDALDLQDFGNRLRAVHG